MLQNEAKQESSLKYLNANFLCIGNVHPVWSSLQSIVSDVRKVIIKCRLLTGTYLLQSKKCKFSGSVVSATCRCCGFENEDLPHMLLYCSSLANQRKVLYEEVKLAVVSYIGENKWRTYFNNSENIIKLLLDSSWFECLGNTREIQHLEKLTTELRYRLHTDRVLKSAVCI